MQTKTFFLSFLLSGFFGVSFADTKPVRADLKEATVFFTGAELTHQTPAVSLKKGDNEIILEGLSPDIDKTDLGVVTWEETLQPGETREYTFSYSVKYPKNMRLNL